MRKIRSRVSKKVRLALALLPLGLTSAAGAFIPPPIAVKVISPDLETEARLAALVEVLVHYENFQWSDNYVQRRRALDCLSEAEADLCMRTLIRETNAARGPLVLVAARRIDEDNVEMRCIGSGKIDPKPDKQVVTLNLKQTFFGDTTSREKLRREALNCIWSAAAEDDSSIK